jgi:hypothetical protein
MERIGWGMLSEPVAAETHRLKQEKAAHTAQLIFMEEAGH